MDLTTEYLGLKLDHPLMPGASPLVDYLDLVRRLEDAGASAIVMHSLFEEQLVGRQLTAYRTIDVHAESFAEAPTCVVRPTHFTLGPETYLEQIRRIKQAVAIPVIASLNGSTPAGWLRHAKLMEEAEADAVEVSRVHLLSDSTELPLRLRGLAVLSGRTSLSLTATGGVRTTLDAVKAVMCGAHAVQLVSALLKRGPEALREVREGLAEWLEQHEYESLRQMRGSMDLSRCPDPRAYERENYVEVPHNWRGEIPKRPKSDGCDT